MDAYGSEDRCREILEELRWPDGVTCPKCGSDKLSRVSTRDQFYCEAKSCGYQFSVTAGTIFHDTHLPLRKWFVATYLMTESRKGISANQIMRMLGIKSYRTAWYLCHRIRAAMVEASPLPLTGVVEADETYIAGKPRRPAGTSRRDASPRTRREIARQFDRKKIIVLGAVERGGKVRLRMVPSARKGPIHGFLGDVIDDHAEAIYTDKLHSYDYIGDEDTVHEAVNHGEGEWVRGKVHTNTIESVWSLFDRAIIGSYHKLSAKYMPAYLSEFEWRFNNRENPFLFRDTLSRLVAAEAMPYKELVTA
jgi:transposase-like protein